MNALKTILIFTMLFGASALAAGQNPQKGTLKGKVKVENGSSSGVTVTVNNGNRSIAHAETNRKGEFVLTDIEPGEYQVTFRKPGLAVGRLENVQVVAGKSIDLGNRLIMHVDEGALAFIEGSVFSPDGRSVPNVRVDVAKINTDGSVTKVQSKFTDDTGQFAFRLSPALAKYRVTVKVGDEPVSREVAIDGAMVYRVALNLVPKKQS